LLVTLLAIVVVLQNRAAVVAIVFLLAVYGVWALGIEGGFRYLSTSAALTVVVLVLANLSLVGLRKAMERGFRIRDDLKLRFPRLEPRANQYMAGLQKALRAAVYVLSTLFILDIWFGEVFAWFASDAGRFVTAHIATIALIVVGALVVWELVTLLIERQLESRDRKGAEIQRSARIRTLLPLLRNVVRVVLAVIVVLTVLAELGVNIAPLLAGAGVVGLAVGFGAQALVKDVIGGTFILLEDAISVGDVVDLGGHSGVVEGMSIRSIRLRDVSGNVHVVPFGEVAALINMTKGFAFALMEVGVAYREDVDEVIEILKVVGEEMRADETYGPLIMEPLEVLGLDSFGDSSVNIRVRLKTLPIKQWMVRREFNRRMKRVFDQKGIEIPFPHVTLYFGVDKQGGAPPARIRQDIGETAAVLPEPAGDPEPTAGR
jgi:small conductance mechanosensitive channel